MYKVSTNPQVQYSLPQLTQGLFYHLQFQPFDKITVSQICQQAGLTRRTFYRNCQRKEDLVYYACDHLIDRLLENVDYTGTDARAMYLHFFSFWYAHRQFLRAVYRGELFSLFGGRFVTVCHQRTRYPLQEDSLRDHRQPETARSFSNSFVLGGLANMLLTWAEEDFLSSPEDLVESVLFLVPKE